MKLLKSRKFLLSLIDLASFGAMYVLIDVITRYLDIDENGILGFGDTVLNFVILLAFAGFSRLVFGVYQYIWRAAGTAAYLRLMTADFTAGAFSFFVTWFLPCNIHFVRTFCVFAGFCLVSLLLRFSYRVFIMKQKYSEGFGNKINVAIVGAGEVGTLLAKELLANPKSHYKPFCFIDSDSNKVGQRVLDLKVFREDDSIIERLKSMPVQEIFIAIPSMSNEELQAKNEFYKASGCKVKIYDTPVSSDGESGERRTLREIRIEDLLFRNSLDISDDLSRSYYKGKVVLVTGGGGSIGSELCRQIAKLHPKKLIIVDIYENNAYDIQQELIRKYGDSLDLSVEIASVRDRARLDCIFAHYRPEVVFHAAAHKHVPLMEHSNAEAIKNNVLGTYNSADMAEKYGVAKFILISTDKAVNPTNIMGASKRMCEMVIQCRTDSATSFAAVRFGNVLGSNGSVIPLFRRQIENGGPITITDKRIIRYFMTIPEASRLVMQAGASAKSGELFVLDMGKPVKIIDLAENMIRLSGFKPYEDIDIVEIGLRSGEKLYEELLIRTEELDRTDNKMIFVERDKPLSRAEVEEKLAVLRDAVERAKDEIESPIVKAAMKSVVPTYHDPEEVNAQAERSAEMAQVR